VAHLQQAVTVEQVNATMREAAQGELEGVLGYTEDPVVSSDMINDPHSSVFDADSTMVTDDRMVKVISWYDNEWGFAGRMVDVVKYLDAHK